MADLFECSSDNIFLHLYNIDNDVELEKDSTTEDFSVVQTEGAWEVRRTQTFYNLDAIIAVDYRVNSKKNDAIPYLCDRRNEAIFGRWLCGERKASKRKTDIN